MWFSRNLARSAIACSCGRAGTFFESTCAVHVVLSPENAEHWNNLLDLLIAAGQQMSVQAPESVLLLADQGPNSSSVLQENP